MIPLDRLGLWLSGTDLPPFVTERVGVVGLGHMAMPLDGCVSATGDADAGPDPGAAFTMAKYQYRARKPRPRRLSYGPYATVGQAPL